MLTLCIVVQCVETSAIQEKNLHTINYLQHDKRQMSSKQQKKVEQNQTPVGVCSFNPFSIKAQKKQKVKKIQNKCNQTSVESCASKPFTLSNILLNSFIVASSIFSFFFPIPCISVFIASTFCSIVF